MTAAAGTRPPGGIVGGSYAGAALLATAVVLALMAGAVLPAFVVSLLSLVLISAVLAASVNMLAGEVGLVSIGHAGIAASAGYGVAWATDHGHDLSIQLGLAVVVTLAVSVAYGLITMRTRGIVFLMITLALGMVVYGLAFKLSSVTGGQNGLTGIARPALLADGRTFYGFVLIVFLAAMFGLFRLRHSPFGLTLRGVRDSESRMASLGYSVATMKFLAIVLSGTLAGVAGMLAVWHSQFMSPAAATFARSAMAVVMVILGGTGTMLGPLVGASVVVGTEHWLSSYVERWPTLLGLVFVMVVLFAPGGVVGGIASLGRRLMATRGIKSAAATRAAEALLGSPPGDQPLAIGRDRDHRTDEEER